MLDASHNPALCPTQPDAFHARNDAPCCGNWGVCYTHPGAERWANDNLTRAGYRTFLPLATVTRRDRVLRSLRHTIQIPLFPRYLFIQHDNPDLWRPIRETPGVHSVLQCANRMQYARAGAVEAVEAALALAAASPPRETAQWAPGDAVALAAGPFVGHPAVVLSVRRDTAHVSVMLFGALRQVQAPVAWLTARD
jgi:transcription antitermination factor NusG